MRTEQTDPLAATRAEQYAQRVARDVVRQELATRTHQIDELVAVEFVPSAIVAEFVAREERADGRRRVVLYGPWEIDPSVGHCTDAR